jgi:hypothetical protein
MIVRAALLLSLAASMLAASAASADYDTTHVGEIYAVNVPGMDAWQRLSLDEARPVAKQYRWVYANASLKDLYEAKDEATKLSNAVNRPLLLVFMPRHIFDATRNEYPGQFHASLRGLIEAALADGGEVLVTGRSYGVHQALRAVRQFDSPKILLIGIAPAFGAFGNAWSDNVQRYVQDVRETRSRLCLIASEDDGFTWRQGGAAYKRNVGYRGDNDVGRAIEGNLANVTVQLLHGADHAPIDGYIRHGLVEAMRKCASRFDLARTAIGDVVYGRAVRVAGEGEPAAPPPPPSLKRPSATPAPPPPSVQPRGATPAPPPPSVQPRGATPAPPPPPSLKRPSATPAPPPPSVQPRGATPAPPPPSVEP